MSRARSRFNRERRYNIPYGFGPEIPDFMEYYSNMIDLALENNNDGQAFRLAMYFDEEFESKLEIHQRKMRLKLLWRECKRAMYGDRSCAEYVFRWAD